MSFLIWPGAAITLAGLACLIYCIVKAVSVQKSDASDDEKRAALGPLVAVNLGGVCLSALGLIMVVVGLLL